MGGCVGAQIDVLDHQPRLPALLGLPTRGIGDQLGEWLVDPHELEGEIEIGGGGLFPSGIAPGSCCPSTPRWKAAGRDAHFLLGLEKAGVDFVAVDMTILQLQTRALPVRATNAPWATRRAMAGTAGVAFQAQRRCGKLTP